MTPAKPSRQVAIAAACNAQTRIVEAIEGLAAYDGADLEGALKDLQLAQGQLEQARLAVRRAIVERDGEASFPGGTNAKLSTVNDAEAQRIMARTHGERADKLEADDELRKWSA